MKKLFSLLAAASVMFLAASCNKDDGTPSEKGMTLTEQAQYLNNSCLEALNQIDAADFQKLADFTNQMPAIGNIPLCSDQFSQVLDYYAKQFTQPIEGGAYFLIEPGKVNMNVGVGKDSIRFKVTESGGITASFGQIEGFTHSYAADLTIKDDASKKILLMNGAQTKAFDPKSGDFWIAAPTDICLNLNIDGSYARIDFRPDFTNFPEDLSLIVEKYQKAKTPQEKIVALLPLLNLTAGADILINGTESYKLHIEKISVSTAEFATSGKLPIEAAFSLYGKDGKYSIIDGSAKLDIGSALTKGELTSKDILDAVSSINLAIANGSVMATWENNKTKTDNDLKLFLALGSTPQMWFNPYELAESEDYSTAKVIHTSDPDHSVTSLNEIGELTSGEFTTTLLKAVSLYTQFKAMFNPAKPTLSETVPAN